jgi:UDP-3-O-[3-hydroxymyristoyl] glucosamine N-acyltransferase
MPSSIYHATAQIHPYADTIAMWIDGQLIDGQFAPQALNGMATLSEAQANEISFMADPKLIGEAEASKAGLIITPVGCELSGKARVEVEHVWGAVEVILRRLYPPELSNPGIHSTAIVGEGVKLGEGVTVGPYCVIGDRCELADGATLGPHCILDKDCQVGSGSRLLARVTLSGPVTLGQRVLIHPGAVLGADGFKFEPSEGRPLKIPQVGRVLVEDDVEIGANTTIDRAFLHETRIGHDTKIDNQVQIAHNVEIGPGCLLAAQVGIAGSTRLGKGCMLGGRACLRDNLTIGDGVMIGGAAGVHTDWPEGSTIMGTPAMEMKAFWRVAAAEKKLPEYVKRLRAAERKLEQRQP